MKFNKLHFYVLTYMYMYNYIHVCMLFIISELEYFKFVSVINVIEVSHCQLFTSYVSTLIIRRKPHPLTTPTYLVTPLYCVVVLKMNTRMSVQLVPERTGKDNNNNNNNNNNNKNCRKVLDIIQRQEQSTDLHETFHAQVGPPLSPPLSLPPSLPLSHCVWTVFFNLLSCEYV